MIVKKPTDFNWVSDQTWFEQRAAEREEKRKHELDEAAEKNKGNAGASIFGGAKPVDDAKLRAREQEIEVSQLIDRRCQHYNNVKSIRFFRGKRPLFLSIGGPGPVSDIVFHAL